MFEFLKKQRNTEEKTAANPVPAAEPEPPKPPYLTAWYTYGMHMYRRANEDSTVYYVDEARGIREMVVDKYGNIQHFPGIIQEDFWVKGLDDPKCLRPQIRFRTDFSRKDGKFFMLWQIEPDGFYYADEDGFGAENTVETYLYSWIGEDGRLAEPFRIYRRGNQNYYPSKE